jgi:GNAT superfamily N-acetyltransferase
MEVVIKKLSPELENDYMEFFDSKAFTDNSEFTGCYCTWYHWTEKLEAERSRCPEYEQKCFKRELAKAYIQKGLLQGYLAYVENKVVGWCNANNRANYDRLSKKNRPDLWADHTENEQVKSIVCFIVSPDMRGIGIAGSLLKAVCEDAVVNGFSYVEAYPAIGKFNQLNYHGPFSMYEKMEFVLHRNDKETIARKYLK